MHDPTTNGSAPPEITSAEEIRRRRHDHVVVTLPSGTVVRVRQTVAAADLAFSGQIPDYLTPHVMRDLDDLKAEASTPEEKAKLDRQRIEVINLLAAAILAEPRMELEGDDPDAIRPEDLAWRDRVHLYGIAMGSVPLDGLARFRGAAASGVRAPSDGEGVLDSSLADPRPSAG